ncbi:MAG TPA: hypothetical protein VIM68_07885, partial [Thermoanaerobaculia bacterium]
YHVDGVEAGENPHVNYEPSSQNALHEAPRRGKDHTPQVRGLVVRQKISRTNDDRRPVSVTGRCIRSSARSS